MSTTIDQIKSNVEEINAMVYEGKAMEAFEMFYDENIEMNSQGEWTMGKDANRTREQFFVSAIRGVTKNECLEYSVTESMNSAYDFVVFALWETDMMVDFGQGEMPYQGMQTSASWWKNGKVVREIFFSMK